MALTSQFFAAKTVTDLVSAINTFLAGEPSTLVIQSLSIAAHDLARFTGIEFRAELLYDPVGGESLLVPLTLQAFDEDQLPMLQQVVNLAIAADPDSLWYALPLLVQDSARRLDRNLALFLRNPDPAAINNIKPLSPGDRVRRVTDSDSPVTAAADQFIVADATGGPITVDLPLAAFARGKALTVIKEDAAANAVDLVASGTELINGAGTLTLSAQYETATVQSDGFNWFIVAQL
jgi:hypothetical protein